MPPFNYQGSVTNGPTACSQLQKYMEDAKKESKTSKDASKSFMSLPIEILGATFEFLPNKRDVLSACLVNRSCFAAAIPVLYHEMSITLKDIMDSRLSQLFTGSSVGVRHIRHLHITVNSNDSPQLASQWLHILSSRLPQDKLKTLTLWPPGSVSKSLILTLWQTQRNIKNLDILPTDLQRHFHGASDSIDFFTELRRIEFHAVDRLRVIPDRLDTAHLGRLAFKIGVITSLEVDACLWQASRAGHVNEDNEDDEDGEEDEHDEENDASEDEGERSGSDDDSSNGVIDRLPTALFRHLPRAKPGQLATYDKLTSLTLKDVDLSNCKYSWCAYLELCHLKVLALEQCVATDTFLNLLSKHAATPGLSSLTIVHHMADRENYTLRAVQDLLDFPKNTLQTLVLSLRNAPVLSISGEQNGPLVYPIYAVHFFNTLLCSCTSLKEFGLPLPSYNVQYYGFAECSIHSYIVAITSNLNLSTLNILNWPVGFVGNVGAGVLAARNPQLSRIAADIFAKSRRCDKANKRSVDFVSHNAIKVVAFGFKDAHYLVPIPVYFVPCEVAVMGLSKRWAAQDVSLRYLRQQQLAATILDYEDRNFAQGGRGQFTATQQVQEEE